MKHRIRLTSVRTLNIKAPASFAAQKHPFPPIELCPHPPFSFGKTFSLFEMRDSDRKGGIKHMLIKWIVCQVPEEKRADFSRAQESWKDLAGADGFYWQRGGWNRHRPSEACILSCWRDQHAYDQFMASLHDTIFQANHQQQTYESIAVTLADIIMEIPDKGSITRTLKGKWLRAADCMIAPGQETHFLNVQQTVWNPALAQSAGMFGGMVAKAIHPPVRYLIFSFWEEEAQRTYTKKVAQLRQQAETDRDTITITGYLVEENERWLVTG